MKEDVFDYLNGILGECWSRHPFDKTCKSDHVTNYFTESFNSWLGSKPGSIIKPSILIKSDNFIQKLPGRVRAIVSKGRAIVNRESGCVSRGKGIGATARGRRRRFVVRRESVDRVRACS
ncbi:hypothetical protein Patl1_32595 [Pistacia atlantica]|uniref:Uncharacterized protein n=1 Tax=Pistacia atlantica TaxID=434234 RepID=A0ACC1AP50_9ROSI|nr:hypothetical protein Patl1_32595 [Pistacia atlantica]